MLLEGLLGPDVIPLNGGELYFWPAFLSQDVAEQFFEELYRQVYWQQSDIVIAGQRRTIPRLNAWYGEHRASYHYSGVQFIPNPWIEPLLTLKKLVEQRISDESAIINYRKSQFNSTLVNLYRDGKDSVSWHSDNEPELGRNPVIASVSLGESRCFQLKHRKDKQLFKLTLPSGSLLLMAGEMQHNWLHQIPKEPAIAEPRINCTFRLVESG